MKVITIKKEDFDLMMSAKLFKIHETVNKLELGDTKLETTFRKSLKGCLLYCSNDKKSHK